MHFISSLEGISYKKLKDMTTSSSISCYFSSFLQIFRISFNLICKILLLLDSPKSPQPIKWAKSTKCDKVFCQRFLVSVTLDLVKATPADPEI